LKLLDGLTSEAQFYKHVAPESGGSSFVSCYDAVYCDDRHWAHVLLEDVSATHHVLSERPPYEQLIDVLADFHAQWWAHPKLCDEVARVAWDPHADVLAKALKGFPAFIDAMRDSLTNQQRQIYEQVLVALPLPDWSQRVASGRQVTVAHGDAHPYNFLYPGVAGDGIYLIDWAIWHIDTGPSDIAYAVAMGHTGEDRARVEAALLERYHRRLLKQGVADYDREQCWLDYRMAVIAILPYTVFWQQLELPSEIWRSNMTCLLAAYEDLACEDLLN
jgi:thiamine kinase-like enzyme